MNPSPHESASAESRGGSDSLTSKSGLLKTLSRPWTQSQSAAAVIVRYLAPMRQQLIQWTGNEAIADDSLKMLIGHLVAQGFGQHGRGKMRDFLIRGIRSAAKATVGEIAENARPTIDFSTWKPDSPDWIAHWRGELLARVWRELERDEHQDLSRPLYTILKTTSAHPRETPEMLAIRINTESDIAVEPATIQQLIVPARKRFAELILQEVSQTLEDRSEGSVLEELQAISLAEPVEKWLGKK
ncbi:MAG TPA: hypothetical protein DDZ51_24385 [Planctomycetaceae bacterium]|nr:hypothetical protein [Planctomycetaceae bacterium]